MCVCVRNDGVFWMAYEDFCDHYNSVEWCRLIHSLGSWCRRVDGWWQPGEGGRLQLKEPFLENPQLLLSTKKSRCEVSVMVSQFEYSHGKWVESYEYIAIYIIRSGDKRGAALSSVPRKDDVMKRTTPFTNGRDAALDFVVWDYLNFFKRKNSSNWLRVFVYYQLERQVPVIIVPCPYEPVQSTTRFWLRIASTETCEYKELRGFSI
jgi:hypothetical protein